MFCGCGCAEAEGLVDIDEMGAGESLVDMEGLGGIANEEGEESIASRKQPHREETHIDSHLQCAIESEQITKIITKLNLHVSWI